MSGLSNIRVVDLTQFLSASYCSQILGDLGADVIKVEPPEKGEVYRTYGPKFINGESCSYLAINRNKRSLPINIRTVEGQDMLKKLIATADVFVENFRPGKLKKYGLDYDSLKAVNPKLVYCSVSGYGQTGPYAHKGGFDLTAQAMSGLMYVTGEQDGSPNKVGYPVADIGGGMYAAIGVLAALFHRESSGKGQLVDASLFEANVAWGMMAALNYFADGSVQGRMGSSSPQNAPYQAFNVKDGSFTMGTGNDALWYKFCEIFDICYLMDNPDYASNALRVANQKVLAQEIEEAIKDLTVADCISRLDEVGIPCGPINSIGQVLADPQVIARDMVLKINHSQAGEIINLAFPVKMSENPCSVRLAPPLLGEHTTEILQELGYSTQEIMELAEKAITKTI